MDRKRFIDEGEQGTNREGTHMERHQKKAGDIRQKRPFGADP
jgi:hypothetical protein